MRLTCPNCSAVYEVEATMIPPRGRDVQCSNCGTTWFQPGSDGMPSEIDGGMREIAAPRPQHRAPSEGPPRRELPSEVKSILREERAREEARRGTSLESQGDLGLEDAPRSRRAAGGSPRRERLPDIEEVNTTLSAEDAAAETAEGAKGRAPARRRGFRAGFLVMVLLALLAAAVYVQAPRIANLAPATGPYLDDYVAQVDRARFWLDGVARDGAARLTEFLGADG